MKALVTVLSPSAGTIRVNGFDSRKQGNEVRERIGYLPQELAMYPSLSVFDFVNYMTELKGIHDKKAVCEIPRYDMRSEGYPCKRGACRSPVLSAGEKEGNHLPLLFRALHTAGNRGTIRTLPEYGMASYTQCLANAA